MQVLAAGRARGLLPERQLGDQGVDGFDDEGEGNSARQRRAAIFVGSEFGTVTRVDQFNKLADLRCSRHA